MVDHGENEGKSLRVKPGEAKQEARIVPLVILPALPDTPWVGLNCPRLPFLLELERCHFFLTGA